MLQHGRGWGVRVKKTWTMALCLALVGLSTGNVDAHGRFPESGSITVDPNDTGRLFVRATYGLLTTADGGDRWHWLCPSAVGFNGDKEDPPIVMTDGGALIAGTFGGPSVARGDLCDFGVPAGDADGRFFIDVVLDADLTRIVAVSSNGITSETFDVKLWESTDEGSSWSTFGTSPPESFLAVSLSMALTDSTRLYVSGRDGMEGGGGGAGGAGGAGGGAATGQRGALYRSDDAGQTWQRFDVPGADDAATLPYIGAVSPSDPDRLYVVTLRQEDGVITEYALLVSDDGGQSFTTVFTAPRGLPGFSLSPDGTQIAIGGKDDGLLVADSTTLSFEQISGLKIGCVTWEEEAMFVCADHFIDGFSVGRSTDGGQTFTGIMELSSPCGPPECAAATTVGTECPPRWPAERAELGAGQCGADDPPVDEPTTGCGCEIVGGFPRSDEIPLWLALLGGLAALASRRRPPPQI